MEEIKLKELTDKLNLGVENLEKELGKKAGKQDVEGLVDNLNTLKDTIAGMELKELDKSLGAYMKSTQDHVDQLEAKVTELTKQHSEPKGLAEQLKKLSTDKDFISALKNKQVKDFTVKASDISTGSFTASTGTTALDQLFIPGITKDPWRDNPLFAAVTKQFVGDKIHEIAWYEEYSRTDAAAGVAEAGSYAQSDAAWKRYKEDFYKIGHFAEFTEESIEDSEYVQGELNDLLTNGVNRQVEKDMWTGLNANNTVAGLINTASQIAKDFAKPTGLETVANANIYDVMRAAKLQCALGNVSDTNKRGYNANIAFLNPVDIANMHLQKNENGNYFMPPFTDIQGNRVAGLTVLESYDLAAGKFLVGDFSKAKAYIKRALNLRTSDNVGSNFLADVITVKAAIRLAFVIKNKEKYAFVYGDIADALTAISA